MPNPRARDQEEAQPRSCWRPEPVQPIALTRLALNTQRWRADKHFLDLCFLGAEKVLIIIGPKAKVDIVASTMLSHPC